MWALSRLEDAKFEFLPISDLQMINCFWAFPIYLLDWEIQFLILRGRTSTMADRCNSHHHLHLPLIRGRPSWICTVATQVALCLALYAAISIGRPQKLNEMDGILRREKPFDLYFLSVRGGFWPPKQQTRLLKQVRGLFIDCPFLFFII